MHTATLHRIAAPYLFLSIGGLVGTACSDAAPPPTATLARSAPALTSQTPSAHGNAIRQRVADKRAARLTAGDAARVKALRGTWQWAADRHHAVMQEAIHDPSIGGLRKERSEAERCDITRRYATKHYADGQARTGKHNSTPERTLAINNLMSQVAGCPTGFTPSPALTSPVAIAWHDYVVAMAADIRTATDLADATEIMDAYLATAAADPDLPPASLTLIAGTIDLATSSAREWDAFARPRQASLFIWGWLSDLGNWIADAVIADFGGCMIGVAGELSGMESSGYYPGFGAFEAACFGGAIIGSINWVL